MVVVVVPVVEGVVTVVVLLRLTTGEVLVFAVVVVFCELRRCESGGAQMSE